MNLKFVQTFRRCGQGSVAIEFALLAPLMMIFCLGFVHVASLALTMLKLEAAVAQTAASLSQTSDAVSTQEEARERICAIAPLQDCETRLDVVIENAYGAAWESGGNGQTPGFLKARYMLAADYQEYARLLFEDGATLDAIEASAIISGR